MRYLLISYLRKMNGQIDEMVNVSKRVRTSDLNNSNVILDFAEKKIVKCVIEGNNHDTTFDQMRNYYGKVYPQLVEQLDKEALITAEQEKKASKIKIKTGR
jgi:hypothetical protein